MVKNNSFVFMGCKHCGKSTHGKAFAEKLGLKFYDVDEVIEQMVGKPVRSYYGEKGVTAFMLAEEAACNKIIADSQGQDVVIATGGGICDNPPALAALRVCGKFVFLRLSIRFSVKRIVDKIEEVSPGVFLNLPAYLIDENGKAPSSIEKIKEKLTEKFQARTSNYEKIADTIVDIKNASVDDNFATITKALSN